MLLKVVRLIYYEITHKNKTFETIINSSNSSVNSLNGFLRSYKGRFQIISQFFESTSCQMLLEVVRVIYYEITHKNKTFETIINISYNSVLTEGVLTEGVCYLPLRDFYFRSQDKIDNWYLFVLLLIYLVWQVNSVKIPI